MTEKEFLQEYDISQFDRPSVAADIAVLAIRSEYTDNYRREANKKLSVLLVKRGAYPYKDKWALPGGFLQQNETLEECAVRKTIEKTGVDPVSVMPTGVFSELDRDPRTRVISHAFVSVLTEDVDIKSTGEAGETKWFDVEFTREGESCTLRLRSDNITIETIMKRSSHKFGNYRYTYISGDKLAFDHSLILAASLSALRKNADNYSVTMDFLPDKFTLNQFQCVQEAILNKPLLAANFRRKAAAFVEETDEYITGAGHRPAKLYTRKEK